MSAGPPWRSQIRPLAAVRVQLFRTTPGFPPRYRSFRATTGTTPPGTSPQQADAAPNARTRPHLSSPAPTRPVNPPQRQPPPPARSPRGKAQPTPTRSTVPTDCCGQHPYELVPVQHNRWLSDSIRRRGRASGPCGPRLEAAEKTKTYKTPDRHRPRLRVHPCDRTP
jgi:hypothetical protein